ncbi:MAG: cadmium-translocating P-type ATPase [Gammaproteobacteria bacterium]|nr:cadmium-translocating P-type ATPase [Gammaproteobacteria bacterium]
MSLSCFHCGELIPDGVDISAEIGGQQQRMCCEGCRAAALMIDGAGLGQFYQIREQLSPTALTADDDLTAVDLEAVQAEFVVADGDEREAELVVEGLRCSACAWLIEHLLGQQAGVTRVLVNLAAQRLVLRWHQPTVALSSLLRLLRQLGYRAIPFLPEAEEKQYRRESQALLIQLAVAAIASMQVMMAAISLWYGTFADMDADFEHYLRWVSLVFSAPVVGYAALPFHLGALRGLLAGKPGMDLPVSLALLLAFGASTLATVRGYGEVYFESVTMFVFFLLIGRLLEHRARRRASEHTGNLRRSMPLMARRLNDDGQLTEVAVATLKTGDRVLVAPGQAIPADARVEVGNGDVDESLLTGESLPVAKWPGSLVYAGSVNGGSPLQLLVVRQRGDSLLANIIRHQTLALAERPRWATLADRIASRFVIGQLLLTAFAYVLWYLWLDANRAFDVALALLVATCPCALALATPAALSSAIARLSQFGVLIRRSSAFEPLAQVSRVVFDKTGTLTRGRLQLDEVKPLSLIDEQQILQLARALEQNSEHPVARALRDDSCRLPEVSDRTNHPGLGVSGTINGIGYALGRPDWFGASLSMAAEPSARIAVTLFADGQPLAHLWFADQLRDDAGAVCALLKNRGLVLEVASGDPGAGAASLLSGLDLEHVGLGLSPQQKQARITALQANGERVLAVGDGINDAPTLAQADCSVAMGAGTDLAKQSADVVMVSERLDGLPLLLRMATAATRIAHQNLGWAMLYNLIVVPLAIAGLITPWFAALGMSLSSVVVVVNASRLLRFS